MTKTLTLLSLALAFIYKTYLIFHTPFTEDELIFVKQSILLLNGVFPFVHYMDNFFSPFFQALLSLLAYPVKNSIYSIFYLKIILLSFFYTSLWFYYKTVEHLFSKKTALYSLTLLNLSFIFLQQNTIIRPSSLSIPLAFILIYLYISKKFSLKNKHIFFIHLIFLTGIDFRIALIGILPLLIFLRKKVFSYTFILITSGILCLGFLTFKNPLSLILTIIENIPSKLDQTLSYAIINLKSDLLILLLAVFGIKKMNQTKTLLFTALTLFLALLFPILRPHTFMVYLMPLATISAALSLPKTFFYSNFKFGASITILFLIMALSKTSHNPWNLSLNDQLKTIKLIHQEEKNKKSVLNLSRFAFDYAETSYFSLLRFEEDHKLSFKNLKIFDYVMTFVKTELEETQPDYIIFSEKDNYLEIQVTKTIQQNYAPILPYLYKKKNQQNEPIEKKQKNSFIPKLFQTLYQTSQNS